MHGRKEHSSGHLYWLTRQMLRQYIDRVESLLIHNSNDQKNNKAS